MEKLIDISETTKRHIPDIVNAFETILKEKSATHLGYPYNLSSELSEHMHKFLSYNINNLGDPFIESN